MVITPHTSLDCLIEFFSFTDDNDSRPTGSQNPDSQFNFALFAYNLFYTHPGMIQYPGFNCEAKQVCLTGCS